MLLNHAIACDSRTARHLRRCAPLLVAMGLAALALTPGMISGDRPFQISLCGDQQEGADVCAALALTASAERDQSR
jgi:hypothetical protein